MIEYTTCQTPVGPIHLAMEGGSLVHVHIQSERHAEPPPTDWVRRDAELAQAAEEIAAYFRGELREFSLPLNPRGTDFQRRTWKELARVPYGETSTYAKLAEAVGSPGASRAVGLAMGNNPLALVLPCHRIVGSNGKLTGYAHGVEMKRALLRFERINRGQGKGRAWSEVVQSAGQADTVPLFSD